MAAKNKIDAPEPLMTAFESKSNVTTVTRTRENRSGFIERTNRYSNIEDGLVPFNYSRNVSNTSSVDVRDAVILCQKAYYNFSVFRNTIDIMTEFSVGDIYFKGGSSKSREFFSSLFNKINMRSFQEKFFREYFRSGNVFVYRFDSKIKPEDALKISQTYGAGGLKQGNVMLPSRYIILNPADIQVGGNLSFFAGAYFKVLTDYEVERLRNPKDEEDVNVFNALDEETKKLIKEKKNYSIILKLDPQKTSAAFYKKQDYEPFSVPLGFPVLEDLNYKKELRKMDMAISRTMQQAILLITMGTEPDKGGVNPKNLIAMQKLFENQSVGRVLVADYTTKAEFVIPGISELLDPKKYEVIDRDIREGLGNVLLGDEKFANAKIKIQVFAQKLKEARSVFLRDFVSQEIKRVSKSLGFKNYPSPAMYDIDLEDDPNAGRIYTRLGELGILTPSQVIEAIETNKLPSEEESLQAQKDLLPHKKSGLYQPMIGNKVNDEPGRPKNTKEIKQVNTTRASEQTFDFTLLAKNFKLFTEFENSVVEILKKKHKKKTLSDDQKSFAHDLARNIAINEEKENWTAKVVELFLQKPQIKSTSKSLAVDEISAKHNCEPFAASLLYESQSTKCPGTE